ncbi:MAG: hypothetical protein K2M59_02510 [Muribaculaceae bacterium]|nr:hypothetical protein [Muribaculaceae bacterium]
MTPKEFFDRANCEDSKYILAKMIKEVKEECRGDLLQYFIEDLKRIADRWRECERVKKYEEENERYWCEVNNLNCYFEAYGIPQEAYEEMLNEIHEPLPLEFYLPVPLPDSFQWTLGKLEEVVITDSVIDTSANELNTSTGLSPEWWEKYPELDTTEARLYVGRAIERGFIKPTSTGFEWIQIMRRGGKAQLGYFLSKVYPQPRPITTLEKLFDVKKLSTYLGNADEKAKRADVIRWRTEIDKIFID